MKRWLEAWLNRIWYRQLPPPWPLRALSGLYRVLAQRDRNAYLQGRKAIIKLPVPVIVVGNRSVGGTGKTPLVIALAIELKRRGLQPGVISRGYGRDSSAPIRVQPSHTAEQVGDEPLLIAHSTGVPVQVDRDRIAAGRALIDAGCDLLIADDGLQHWRLARDIEIEVIDGTRGYGNGWLLPAGPLRQPIDMPALPNNPISFRVINGAVSNMPDWSMQLIPDNLREICSDARVNLNSFAGQRVHAVAGIGNPARFFQLLIDHGIDVVAHPFSDHHQFAVSDFRSMKGNVLMTSKDAVKCHAFANPGWWEVPVQAQLPAEFFDQVYSALKK